jgi:hypothetical protein
MILTQVEIIPLKLTFLLNSLFFTIDPYIKAHYEVKLQLSCSNIAIFLNYLTKFMINQLLNSQFTFLIYFIFYPLVSFYSFYKTYLLYFRG